jgi:hypothetical protein
MFSIGVMSPKEWKLLRRRRRIVVVNFVDAFSIKKKPTSTAIISFKYVQVLCGQRLKSPTLTEVFEDVLESSEFAANCQESPC